MRNTILCLSILFLISCDSEKPVDQKFLKKHEPFVMMNFQRAYPDASVDLTEMNKAIKRAKLHAENPTKNVDVPWTLEGPKNIGGRINCVTVHPENDSEIWIGNSTGGVFRTTDSGENWEPMADDLAYLSVGSIAFNPINTDEIYIGSGDPNIGGLPHPGNGIYKSVDGGLSWEHKGLENERIVSEIKINYNNPDTVFAGTMGTPFERDNNRGLYRSVDGGDSWEQVLLVSDEAGIIDMEMDFENPSIIYASSWNRIRNNQESMINGADAHVYKSIDGGDTWEMIEFGLPEGEKGRIGLAMSGQDPNKIYCVIVGLDSQLQGIYKSNDGGEVWNVVPTDFIPDNALGGFGWYFGKISVSPYDDDEISLLGVDMYTTYNGGLTWALSVPIWWMYEVHADKHDMVYLDEETVLLATDGGLYKTENGMGLWQDIEDIPNTQFYRIALDPFHPEFYTGGAQDNGTTTGNEDSIQVWTRDFGGDGFQAIYHPENELIKYTSTQNGNFYYFDGAFDFWESFNEGIDELDRTNWDSPLIMSAHDPELMYTGTYRVYKNDLSPFGFWSPISEDLTDGVIFGNAFHTISTVAESRVNPDFLYAGTTDGNVWHYSAVTDLWENVSDGLPDRYVTNIKTSPEEEATIYVSHSGFKDNDNTSHMHKSEDFGATWIDISGDMPEQPVNHLEIVNDSIYFAATDYGVYFTENSGVNWNRVGNNMPLIPVYDIEVDTVFDRLIAGTFARSIWSFPIDSLYPLESGEDTIVNVNDMIANDFEMLIYPNPAEDQLRIQSSAHWEFYEIYNFSSQKISQGIIFDQPELMIEVKGLKAGVYFILLKNASGQKVIKKFVKQ